MKKRNCYCWQKKNHTTNKKFCHICEKEFDIEFNDDENYQNGWGHCHCVGKYRQATHSIFSLRYKTQQEISVVLRN